MPVYGCKVHFSVVEDGHEEDKYMHKKYKLPYVEEEEDFEGKTLNFNIAFCMIVVKKFLTYNTVGHEMYHLTSQMCSTVGVEDEEQRCWVQGFLMQEFMNFCKKKGYEIH